MVQLGLDAVLAGTPSSISKTKVRREGAADQQEELALLPGRHSDRCRRPGRPPASAGVGPRSSAAATALTLIGPRPPAPGRLQVVCTLGPMSRSVEVVEELLRAGMNVARFNFSHGSHEYHQVGGAMPGRLGAAPCAGTGRYGGQIGGGGAHTARSRAAAAAAPSLGRAEAARHAHGQRRRASHAAAATGRRHLPPALRAAATATQPAPRPL